jgi:beta-galactosidase
LSRGRIFGLGREGILDKRIVCWRYFGMRRAVLFLFLSTFLFLELAGIKAWSADRQTISLDGEWDIAEGPLDTPPGQFSAKVPVPGLVDMAQPAFTDVGAKSSKGEAFWYRKQFKIDGPVPAVAILRIAKAFFGTKVYLNGVDLGEHLPLFTPGYFDVQKNLLGAGKENELIIRVGASPDALPATMPRGHDGEKSEYIPGIFDSVQLILSGTPNLVRIQAAPDITQGKVHIQALVHDAGPDASTPVTFTVKEKKSGTVVGTTTISDVHVSSTADQTVDAEIPIPHEHLWSPEDPFLYTVEVTTTADKIVSAFGMREFHFDVASRRAYLNGKPYFMRGANTTLYRFFEDSERGDLPWNHKWVQLLHQSFKQFHWNSFRWSIGFPPEFWYDIADEEGFLIQDEFPIWGLDKSVTTDELAQEYTAHMQETWNHPSVVIWDSQNETIKNAAPTGEAVQQVRHLDLSNRPWDNGWGGVQAESDPYESHPYHFIKNDNTMPVLATALKTPLLGYHDKLFSPYKSPIIVNEYGGIWLQRDGQPTKVSKIFYDHILGPNATAEQRFATYAHYMAAETEFWRGNRNCAAVLEFTALGYSEPIKGTTSDHFTDVKNLVYEPHMAEAFKNAFAPVGLMIDYWETEVIGASATSIPVVVINDLEPAWSGKVHLVLQQGGKTVFQQDQTVSVESFGSQRVTFAFPAPTEPGSYDLQATILGADGQTVTSDRAFPVISEADQMAKAGYPVVAATASSEHAQGNFLQSAMNATRDNHIGWGSDFNIDPQWIALDLGTPRPIGRVVLNWQAAYATSYRLETSSDGQNWTPVYTTDAGKGGTETLTFPPVTARYIRMFGIKRATKFGYFLWGFHVYGP